ncbi:hypothetical protein MPH_06519 [Macrophomina phaseolina MS6]|uniref:Rhodopsin domain-containing protein n=1 Tax=Macrophomina phaseolina (strain MS6) TaxID=1126212 RepID=K2SHE4_MACPH|nr:hypothetical protein MPH_06519 [Macrophomina phaseolina MS6]
MGVEFLGITGATYVVSLLFTKLSILVFYLNFSGPSGKIRKAIWVTMIIVTVYSLTGAFEWAYACQPIEKYWDLTITYGHCIDRPKIYMFAGVMNTLTDATILLLPIFMMWNLRLRLRQKIAVVLIMMTGGFVLVVSIIRVSMTAELSQKLDKTWFYATLVAW